MHVFRRLIIRERLTSNAQRATFRGTARRMLVSKPPKGGTRTAADAVGVGRREALGVRQLAAALFLCANNVSGTTSA